MSTQTVSQTNAALETARPASLTPELLALLRNVSILSSLSDAELKCLDGVDEVEVNEGDVLLHQGEFARHFVILLSGKVSVFRAQSKGAETEVATYAAGSAFGELPLLANQPLGGTLRAMERSHLLLLDEEEFWKLMTTCPHVRRAILGNMAQRFQKYQNMTLQQEKMVSLGTLAAGLMHELNNPGAAAKRAASQLRENLQRMHEVGAKLSQTKLTDEQKECMVELKSHAMAAVKPVRMNSIEQSDAEEELAAWMENAQIENAWKLAPTLVSIGMSTEDLECARSEFPPEVFSDCLSWLEALVSSMQLVGMIEESIGRVTELIHAVKSYAYEGKGARQSIDVNDSIHATLVILAHKMREKQIVVEREFGDDLPPLQTDLAGINQVWTNILDNAIDAVGQHGVIRIRTWTELRFDVPHILISIADNGSGIPLDVQPRIFDPFYTTKEVGVGTGLGLGIVSRIVEQFGGTIRFSSEPGRTEFFVTLPTTRK
jgi:signal transduction histidine kinase